MKKLLLLPLLFLIHIGNTSASGEMSLRGTLLDSVPCDINNGEALSVDFGEVGVNKIDGVRYQQVLSFPVNCQGKYSGPPFRFIYSGQVSDFDPAALKTTADGLGVKLKSQCNGHDYCELEIGGYQGVNMMGMETQLLNFLVVPVKNKGAVLEPGEFNANASFRLDYY